MTKRSLEILSGSLQILIVIAITMFVFCFSLFAIATYAAEGVVYNTLCVLIVPALWLFFDATDDLINLLMIQTFPQGI